MNQQGDQLIFYYIWQVDETEMTGTYIQMTPAIK